MNAESNYDFLKSLSLDKDVVNKISLLLDRIVAGSSEVYTTPIANETKPDVILDKWDVIFQSRLNLMSKELIELEESQKSKYGPRSLAKPWVDRRETLKEHFGSGSKYSFDAKEKAFRRLRPVDLKASANNLKRNTNSGLPYYMRKGKVIEQSLDNYEHLLSEEYPCILFTRTQENGKTRTVWGYPIADTLLEGKYFLPLLEYQKKQPWRSALIGPEEVNSKLTTLILSAVENDKTLVSIDFSSYDSTVKESLQMESFNYIKSLFQENEAILKELNYIANRFNSIGLITPDGIWGSSHGVPSGSTFTNEVDSIAQYLVAKQVLKIDDLFQIQGDDGAYAVSDPDVLKQNFLDYGLKVNIDKSYESKEYIIYLQNLYSINHIKNGRISGIYPIYRALSKIVYQERFNDFKAYGLIGADYYAIRTISILENCKYHPLFEDFVKFVYNLDKYGLTPSETSIGRYIGMLTDEAGFGSIFKHQYGDDLIGLKSFECVKIIDKLNKAQSSL